MSCIPRNEQEFVGYTQEGRLKFSFSSFISSNAHWPNAAKNMSNGQRLTSLLFFSFFNTFKGGGFRVLRKHPLIV